MTELARCPPRGAPCFSLAAVVVALAACQPSRALAQAPCVLRADLDGAVHRAAAGYLERGLRAVEGGTCSVLLVVIDTPGGALDATRSIAQTFLGARAPVIAYVYPSGARAGSAGLFVTAAAHVAAMAPGTNIGAAHPVTIGGGDPEQSGGEHMAKKLESDTAAFARAIGEQRGRNVEWLEKAVVESASATAEEAHELDVIDIVTPSIDQLLEAADGRTVELAQGEATLRTAGAAVRELQPTIQEWALSVIGDPNVAYLLMMLGMLGLLIELYNPGVFIAGGVGLFCLLLGALGMGMLPVQLGAVVLIAVGLALLVAELFVSSFGLLTVGGAGALLLGSALLIDQSSPDFFAEPSFRVSYGLVIPLVLLLSAVALGFAWQAGRLRGRRPFTGTGELEGAAGRAVSNIDSESGWVQVLGERWRARSDRPLAPNTKVRVVGIEGLTLKVVADEGKATTAPRDELTGVE